MKKFVQVLLLGFLVIALSGCPGGSSSDGGPTASGLGGGGSSGTGGTSGDGSDGSTGGTTTSSERLGSFDGTGTFNNGVINANDTTLAAGESTSLSVSIVDQDGNLVTDAADIFFTSNCIASGLSEVNPSIGTNSTGTVNATYTAIGCDGTDTVRAQTSVNSTTLSGTVAIETVQAPLGAIAFESASPQVIGIRGSGAIPEQSTVTFKVTNSAGGPVPNQVVDFSLNNTLGGVSLSNPQGTTNADGVVTTTVTSGDVATTVRVTATATQNGTTTNAQSNGLAITTGIPDQDSFSISTETFNIEGFNINGITTKITVHAADRFNNPVANGTAITFTTEGASIEGSCLTVNGACSATLTSQSPRPSNGRITVMASAIGEESFNDANPSNGRFDDAETFSDLPEAFRDDNFDGNRDSTEPFVDFNTNGTYDPADGVFNGLLCNGPGLCASDSNNTLTVFNLIEIILSSSFFNISASPSVINLDFSESVFITVEVKGNQGQIPPAGTTVTGATSQGTIVGGTSFTIPNSAFDPAKDDPADDPSIRIFQIKQGSEPGDGRFTVTAKTPLGNETIAEFFVTQTVTPP